MDLIKKNTGETRTSLALTVRTRASKTGSTFKEAAFKVAKTLENLAFKGSLNLNKEAAFTLSGSEPGPHELKISNFHGEVDWFNIQSNTSLHFASKGIGPLPIASILNILLHFNSFFISS